MIIYIFTCYSTDEKTKKATDITACLRVVIKSRIDRNGFVILPSKDDKYGVEHVTNVDEAVSIIEDWIRSSRQEDDNIIKSIE